MNEDSFGCDPEAERRMGETLSAKIDMSHKRSLRAPLPSYEVGTDGAIYVEGGERWDVFTGTSNGHE